MTTPLQMGKAWSTVSPAIRQPIFNDNPSNVRTTPRLRRVKPRSRRKKLSNPDLRLTVSGDRKVKGRGTLRTAEVVEPYSIQERELKESQYVLTENNRPYSAVITRTFSKGNYAVSKRKWNRPVV